jgi:hypothetical protein
MSVTDYIKRAQPLDISIAAGLHLKSYIEGTETLLKLTGRARFALRKWSDDFMQVRSK